MKHTIWTNDLDFEDWKEDLEEQYPDYTQDELIDIMYEINDSYLDDEKVNLDKELNYPIVMFGELHLWNGVQYGYKFLKSTNLKDILTGSCGDWVTWYVDGKDIKCKDCHHDGTNYYTYRVLKPWYSKDKFEEHAWKYGADKSFEMMTEPLGHYIADIYGFELETA